MTNPRQPRLTDPEARLTLFGHEATPAEVEVVRRPTGWRIRRALPFAVATLVLTPAAALVPPHAPWVAAALGGGLLLTRRRWLERFTLFHLEGSCPRCGGRIHSEKQERLRETHSMHCPSCDHEAVLRLDPSRLVRR